VGIYGAAQNLSVVPSIFAMAFAPLLLATLTHLLRDGARDRARAMARDAMRAVVDLLPFAAMTAGAAAEVVGLLFGPAYLAASPLLALLIFGALAQALISVTGAILTAADRPGWTLVLAAPLPPLALAGHLLLIPRLDALGAALVTTGGAGLGALAAVLAVHRLWRVLPPAASVARSLVVCGLAYALAVLWPAPDAWLLLKLPAITVAIGLAFLALGELGPAELALARSLLRPRAAPERRSSQV
jgi:O-antigen/teichoic acid export membrane protein